MESNDTLTIRYYTDRFTPNHSVSLRTSIDGDGYPIHGTYMTARKAAADLNGHWRFDLDAARFRGASTIDVRFVLDSAYPMEGDPLRVEAPGEYSFDEDAVVFPPAPDRYAHGHDNLQTFETPVQQRLFLSNHNENVEYDVVIIGSGMGGGILADELADKGAKVLLLEAGSALFPTHTYDLPGKWEPLKDHYFVYQHRLPPGSTFENGVKINFGGGSVFWSGVMQEARRWEIEPDWPADVQRYLLDQGGYGEAAKLMNEQVSRGKYEEGLLDKVTSLLPEHCVASLRRARDQPHLERLPDGKVVEKNVIRESSGMFSTVDLLVESISYSGAEGRENLTINCNHMVVQAETDGPRVTSVVCADLLANKMRRYRGKFFVFAAGSISSARIALQSKLVDPSGLIGHGITDHPHFAVRYEWGLEDPPIRLDDHAKLAIWHKDAADEHHPYNIEVLVNYLYWDVHITDDDIWNDQIGTAKDRIGLDVQFFFPSKLGVDNSVRLDPASKKVLVHTVPNDGGRAYVDEIQDMAAVVRDTITGGAAPRWQSDLRYFDAAQIGHAGGTLRMGATGSSVVDATLRFHEYDNLYAADLSVFPSILAAKPSLTLAALNLRLAETLLDRLGDGLRGPSGSEDYCGARTRLAAASPYPG